MGDAGTCVDGLLLLPELVPVIAAALTFNMTYLLLERRRYRDKIRKSAKSLKDELDKGGFPDNLKAKSKSYMSLAYFAYLPNNDGTDPSRDDGDNQSNQKTSSPGGWWGGIYKILFSQHIDKYIAEFLTLACVALLSLAVAHKITKEPLFVQSSCEWIWYLFWGVIVAGTIPVFFLFLGWRIEVWGIKLAGECAEELRALMKYMQDTIKNVEIKQP